MYRAHPWQAIAGGFSGALLMLLLLMLLPMFGLPKMDMASIFASRFQGWQAPSIFTGAWLAGLLIYFGIHALAAPLVYTFLARRLLPGNPAMGGLQWGILLWSLFLGVEQSVLAAQGSQLVGYAAGACLGYIVYGLMLGAGEGSRAVYPRKGHARVSRLAA